MSRFVISAALLVTAAVSGCCHPCCAPYGSNASACQAGCRGGHCWQLSHWHGKFHSLWHPPRPAEVTPPVPRFHPVPARPVFEIPPADAMPVMGPTGQPLPAETR